MILEAYGAEIRGTGAGERSFAPFCAAVAAEEAEPDMTQGTPEELRWIGNNLGATWGDDLVVFIIAGIYTSFYCFVCFAFLFIICAVVVCFGV